MPAAVNPLAVKPGGELVAPAGRPAKIPRGPARRTPISETANADANAIKMDNISPSNSPPDA